VSLQLQNKFGFVFLSMTLSQIFIENYARIQVFWSFDQLSNVSGSKVMA